MKKHLTTDEFINDFINQLSYFEQINLLMSYYMANDANLTRVDAYEKATIHYFDDEVLTHSLRHMIFLGPTSR